MGSSIKIEGAVKKSFGKSRKAGMWSMRENPGVGGGRREEEGRRGHFEF